ncbi:MAG: glycosyltransferase [bacterium]
MKTLISILLPTCGEASYISEAIESVLKQNLRDWELIIISDPPLGAEAEKVIEKYSQGDDRIICLKNKTRMGFQLSLNRGLKTAMGRYIARIDDDDTWSVSDKLEKQVDFLEAHTDYVLVGAGATVINHKGEAIYSFLEPETDSQIRDYILYRNPFLHSSVIFRKEIAKSLGGYDDKLKGADDYDLWLRMGKVGKLYNFPQYWIEFRAPQRNIFRVPRYSRTVEKIQIIKNYQRDYPHFYQAVFKDYLKLVYLLTLGRFSKLDKWLYRKRQILSWRV